MLGRFLRQNAAVLIGVLTFIVLAIHPVPDCVACEYPNPWARNDTMYLRDSNLLVLWLILASFYAAVASLKRSWFVPFGIVFGDAVTQLRGRVTWESLVGNEGPMILIVGLSVGALSLVAGRLARHVYHSVRHKLSARQA